MEIRPDTLLVVRHGSTAHNSGSGGTERFRGHANIPLNAKGKKQALEIAHKLQTSGATKIVSSDLDRALDTAKAIGKAINIKPVVDKRLRPWDVGDLTGAPVDQGIALVKAYAKAHPDVAIPGGESFNAFKGRAIDVFWDLLHDKDGPTIAVTHTRDVQALKAWLANGKLDPAFSLQTFNNYSGELEPGQYLMVTPKGKGWTISTQS